MPESASHVYRPLVYVAGPYTWPDPETNVRRAVMVGEELEASGLVTAFVPHVSHLWEQIAHHEVEHWYDYDLALLARCDAFLALPGPSVGVCAERLFAASREIPVFCEVEDVLSWARERSQKLPGRIIALGHRSMVGKDSVARVLVERHGFRRVAFADALKAIVGDLAPYFAEPLRNVVQSAGADAVKLPVVPGGRGLLVELGMSVRSHLGEDAWIRQVVEQASNGGDWVVSDLRFANEAEALRALGARLVRVERQAAPAFQNPADTALDGYSGWDAVLRNDGTFSELGTKVGQLLKQLFPDGDRQAAPLRILEGVASSC